MPEPVLVAVAHGSQDPRASATVGELMAIVAERASPAGLWAHRICAPPTLATPRRHCRRS